jgi:hypothetical protein
MLCSAVSLIGFLRDDDPLSEKKLLLDLVRVPETILVGSNFK